MKTAILLAILLFAVSFSPPPSRAESGNVSPGENRIIPVCGASIALRFRNEVSLPGKPDKFKHCALSCVMTLYCGPIESFELGALKELYDALGFGTPDIEDLKADLTGIKTGIKIGFFGERNRCYEACSGFFP